jgi:hypothetical protein
MYGWTLKEQRMGRILSTVAVVAVVAGFGSYALADHDADFKDLDTNGDGKVSMAEFTAGKEGADKSRAEAKFKECDANSDGSLTLDEYKNGHKDEE